VWQGGPERLRCGARRLRLKSKDHTFPNVPCRLPDPHQTRRRGQAQGPLTRPPEANVSGTDPAGQGLVFGYIAAVHAAGKLT